jgi:hypothetical protein
VRYRHDGELLFGVVEVVEDTAALGGDSGPVLQRAGRQAYESVFRLLAEEGYPTCGVSGTTFPASTRRPTASSVTGSSTSGAIWPSRRQGVW